MTRNSLVTIKTAKIRFRKCIYSRLVPPVLKSSCPENYRRLLLFLAIYDMYDDLFIKTRVLSKFVVIATGPELNVKMKFNSF